MQIGTSDFGRGPWPPWPPLYTGLPSPLLTTLRRSTLCNRFAFRQGSGWFGPNGDVKAWGGALANVPLRPALEEGDSLVEYRKAALRQEATPDEAGEQGEGENKSVDS